MTPLLATAGGLIAGACVGYALRTRFDRSDNRATFRAGCAHQRWMDSTAGYNVPEPVEMDGRETWGRA